MPFLQGAPLNEADHCGDPPLILAAGNGGCCYRFLVLQHYCVGTSCSNPLCIEAYIVSPCGEQYCDLHHLRPLDANRDDAVRSCNTICWCACIQTLTDHLFWRLHGNLAQNSAGFKSQTQVSEPLSTANTMLCLVVTL